jgi:hypothetical protein
MTKQVYKSANGKMVDMGSLALQNEMTRAVGNMKVNARGDLIDEHNRVISKKTDQVNQTYNQQTGKTP